MSLQRDFEAVDDLIRRLGREYQLYVSGQRRRRPDEERQQLDQLVRRLAGMRMSDNAARFRFSNLQVKYNLYCERWKKLLREYEEGPIDPKERAKILAAVRSASLEPPPPPPSPPAANARSRDSVQIQVGREDEQEVRRIYDLYATAREQAGEAAASRIGFEKFRNLIASQGAQISQRTGSDTVEFGVKIKDGKVKLVAKPRGGRTT